MCGLKALMKNQNNIYFAICHLSKRLPLMCLKNHSELPFVGDPSFIDEESWKTDLLCTKFLYSISSTSFWHRSISALDSSCGCDYDTDYYVPTFQNWVKALEHMRLYPIPPTPCSFSSSPFLHSLIKDLTCYINHT